MPLVSTGGGGKSPAEDVTKGCWEKCQRKISSMAPGRRREEKITAEAEGRSWKELWDALTGVES